MMNKESGILSETVTNRQVRYRNARFRKALKILTIPVAFLLLFIAADLSFPLKDYSSGYSTVVYSDKGEIIHCFLSNDDKWRIRSEYSEISGDLAKAIIFKEDRYFNYHPGINPASVLRAIGQNTIHGKRTSGASTITMQLARMLEPAERNWKSKLRESFRALQLEWHFSKKDILTMYLNLLPYGGNIEGVKAASMIYFGQQPAELSPAQLAMLTVIPNNPNVLKPSNSGVLKESRNKWLLRMGSEGIFTHQEVNDGLWEEVETIRHPLPRIAPHLAYRLKALYSGTNNIVKGASLLLEPAIPDRIYTTLDLTRQSMIESAVRNYIRPLRNMMITNAAVLMIDNRTMQVKAYIGSAGFNEKQFSGEVDGIRAIRSPGSALKPALYMLAFDQGLVSPKSRITDVPVNYSGYRPENYDDSYRGQVTIEEALSLSLNVPAVNLLEQAGIAQFTQMLSSARFNWIARNSGNVGLSVVLGGCGTTLEELSGLYAAIANQGIWKPLAYTTTYPADRVNSLKGDSSKDISVSIPKKGNDNEGTKIASAGSAYMITNILTQLKRPDLPNEYLESAALPRIAWKTGTSYGRRDAWAIGYNAQYTIGVWTGNFDGTGVPELNGTDVAVPLLFMIFNQVSKGHDDWFFAPDDVDFRLVCSESGMLPDTFCHHRVMEAFLPGISPSVRCNHLKPVFTDKNKTVSYCTWCLPANGYAIHFYPNHPPDLINYFEEMSIPYQKIPPHNSECTHIPDDAGPAITSLTDGAEYLIFKGRKQKLMLRSNCAADIKSVFWYINNKLHSKAGASETVYLQAIVGTHTITCIDDRGRSSSIKIKISEI